MPEEISQQDRDQLINSANLNYANSLDKDSGEVPVLLRHPRKGFVSGIDDQDKKDSSQIIGLPPSTYYDAAANTGGGTPSLSSLLETHSLNRMPVMVIEPALPLFGDERSKGATLYSLDTSKGETRYKNILKRVGIHNVQLPLKVAFLNDVSISESLTVEFGESSIEDLANFGSAKLQELSFLTGETDPKKMMEAAGGKYDGLGKSAVQAATSAMGSVLSAGQSVLNNLGNGLGNIMMGHKVDFPKIWKGNTYTPSYAVTVRLYNPYPISEDAHETFIVEPLAKIMALAVPASSSTYTYTYPLMCKIKCPGLFVINAGYVSSIDIVKGGESNDITYDQRPSSVDVKISFQDVYSVLLTMTAEQHEQEEFRPTYSRYIETLRHSTTPPPLQHPGRGSGASGTSPGMLNVERTTVPNISYEKSSTDYLYTPRRVGSNDLVDSLLLTSSTLQSQDTAAGNIQESTDRIGTVLA